MEYGNVHINEVSGTIPARLPPQPEIILSA